MTATSRFKAVEKMRFAIEKLSREYLSHDEIVAFANLIVTQMLKLRIGTDEFYGKYNIYLDNLRPDAIKPYTLELVDAGFFIPFCDVELNFLKSFFSDEVK